MRGRDAPGKSQGFALAMALLLFGTLQCARVPARSLPTSWITSHPGWATYTNANQVSDLAFDSDGNLWAVGNGGVVKWNLTAATYNKFTVDDGLANDCVSSVATAPDGAVWVGTRRGASRFDGHNWTTYTEADGLADNWDTTIAAAPDGAVWIATDGGVSRYVPPR